MSSDSETSPRFRFSTFGSAELWSLTSESELRERVLGPGKPLALLAYCCCARDREHSRDLLASLLWNDTDAAGSRRSLRQALWRIRRLLGEYLRTRDDAVVGIDEAVHTDREDFIAAVRRNDALLALKLYSGPFLNGLAVPGGDEFEDWAAIERRHLEESLVRVVGAFARTLIQSGLVSQARDVIKQLTSRTPDSLDAQRIAVEVMLDARDVFNARSAADALESVARNLGGRAPASVKALIDRARNADSTSATDNIATFELDLVGRADAFGIAIAVWNRARQSDTQVIVITGVAGIGKSRLLATIAQRTASARSQSVTVRANPGERDVLFGFAAAIARALSARPGAAGISSDSARELVALDPGLGSTFSTTPSLTEGGEAVRRRALAMFDLLSAIAEQEPLALLLDDLHWADVASRQLLSIVASRAVELPLMILATTRSASSALFDQRTTTSVALLPLDREEMVDAVRSSGTWPETAQVAQFISMLATVCEGIPLSVMERLSFVRDRELLTLTNGIWESSNWPEAISAIGVASPLDHTLAACTEVERAVLLALAVAGKPISETAVTQTARTMIQNAQTRQFVLPALLDLTPERAALRTLEMKALAHRASDVWVPNHDVITERMLALASILDRRECHRAFAATLAASVDPDAAASAVRHFLLGCDDRSGGKQLARVVSRARALGDRRSARELLFELIGERLPETRVRIVLREVPLWIRAMPFRMRSVAAMAAMVSVVSVMIAWHFANERALIVLQSPASTTLINGNGPDVRRAVPSIAIGLSDSTPISGIETDSVHVRALNSRLIIVGGGAAPLVHGVASFTALRFRSDDSIVNFRFELRGFRSADIAISQPREKKRGDGTALGTLRLAGGELHSEPLAERIARVTVAPGELISGTVKLQYSTQWPAASVWISMTPTWGNAKDEGRELAPLMTPVQHEVVDVPIAVFAPAKLGHYWLLFLLDAEPTGMYALSRTNWTVGHPVWGDGNDFASLSDSTIRLANVSGAALLSVAYPQNWNTTERKCTPDARSIGAPRIKYCEAVSAMFGIEVVVR